jgi:RND family efflux transporter MFP subunit
MKLLIRILVPIGTLAATILTVVWMMANQPTPQMRVPPPSLVAVDATRLQPTSFQVKIPSQGVVKPRTKSTLKTEVGGRVMTIAPSFREGGFFEEGDTLLTLDPRDYQTAVTVAAANLAQREAALELEKAQHDQALENWKLLGDGSDPSPLTLREPQLAEAIANVESARARLEEAQRNLTKTSITAPYAGRVQTNMVDVGQFVSPGNSLADIFAVDYAEIRLSLQNEALDFIQLPEGYRGNSTDVTAPRPGVVLKGRYGSREVTWEGVVVRADGTYDARSRMQWVVAQVDDPYGRATADVPPLKVGQYVTAELYGDLLENIFVIPRSAVRDGNEVLLVNQENQLRRTPVSIIWRQGEECIVAEGLKAGDVLCVTPMTFAADGTQVLPTIDGVAPPPPNGPGGKSAPGAMAQSGPATTPQARSTKTQPAN